MTLDAPLVAAATLHRSHGTTPCSAQDATYQLQLAHVLLDGGYDGVATLEEALRGGDLGLGTVDKLDGELVIVDGEPWRVDWHGTAHLMPPDARTPFVIVTTMDSPATVRLRDVDLAGVQAAIEDLVDDPGSIVSVRLEGSFHSALNRSVKPQEPPYRPIADVCATDEVRWEHSPFYGVFVGFRFPDIDPSATIAGLHLHGLDRLRTTGGHNYDLTVNDAVLSVGVSRDVGLHLPDKSMADMLEAPPDIRAVQRALLRGGTMTIAEISRTVAISPEQATSRLEWLADRGFVDTIDDGADTRWRVAMHTHARTASGAIADILESL